MTISEMQKLLDADILFGEELTDLDVKSVFSADMMSDVLAYGEECSVLITGLCNPQVVRTAEMLDIACIIFVRGKMPDQDIISLAKGKKMAILATKLFMFTACGILYEHGLRGGA
ncbi:DRTGG domain-containing protein [Luxibacter massiliensis]|uniref:DRTGG domain-containing protein n=1 Tax=Luxibacter massiliensis TaxID=2219695 RepID=UPI000F04E1AA|nr:DRTGG domain-containing protein [Luxibacter massiliensis]